MKSLGLFFQFLTFSLFGQQDIILKNPSFEEVPRPGLIRGPGPVGWYDCSLAGESAPDIQPGNFQVFMQASEGKAYLGMVVRDNNTWESISQELEIPFRADSFYLFQVDLARSDTYLSPSRVSASVDSVNFNKSTVLNIWAGYGPCHKGQLLKTSAPITHTNWRSYSFLLQPKKDYTHITLEAYYKKPSPYYNGNLLIDHCSALRYIPNQDVASLNTAVRSVAARQQEEDSLLIANLEAFEQAYNITSENLGQRIFALIDSAQKEYKIILGRELSRAYFLQCLNQYTVSDSLFQKYWTIYPSEQLRATARLLSPLGLNRQLENDFRNLVYILERKEKGKKMPRKFRKIEPEKLIEKIRKQLLESHLNEKIDSLITKKHVVLFMELYYAIDRKY
jgi:hypothetical protein